MKAELLKITLETLSNNMAAPISATLLVNFKADNSQSDALMYKAPPKLA